jgi:hypothetical protein
MEINKNNLENLENYYKNIDKPIINDCLNKFNLKNLLELSTITNLYVFNKQKKKDWRLKEKRMLLKECDIKRKQKLKAVTESINELSKNKSKDLLLEVKQKNNSLFNEIETIDTLIETIEKDYPDLESKAFLEKFSN